MQDEEGYEQAKLRSGRRPVPTGTTMGEVLAKAFKKLHEKGQFNIQNRFKAIQKEDEDDNKEEDCREETEPSQDGGH